MPLQSLAPAKTAWSFIPHPSDLSWLLALF